MSTTNADAELNVPEGSVPLTRRQIREREMAQQAPVAPEEPAVVPEPVIAEATVSSPPIPVSEPVVEPVTPSRPVVTAPVPAPPVAVEAVPVEDLDDAVVVLDEPYAVPVAKVRDSSLPSLFGDDPEEDEIEVPLAAAEYAREAPAAKYLDDEQPRRIVLPYAPTPAFADAAPRQHYSKPVAHGGEWTGKTKLKIVALSVLFYGLAITQTAIYLTDLIAQINASGATSL